MLRLIKHVLITLLNFSRSLATKLDNTRHTLFDLNPYELSSFWCRVSLDRCNGSCNTLNAKIYVQNKTEDVNIKVFSMITVINEAK